MPARDLKQSTCEPNLSRETASNLSADRYRGSDSVESNRDWSSDHGLDGSALLADDLTDEQQERLARILDEYMIAVEEGRDPGPESLIQSNPDLGETLRLYLSGLHLVRTAAHAATDDSDKNPFGTLEFSASTESRPTSLGDYDLGEELGRGAMGIVYSATHRELGKSVAIKVLAYSTSLDPGRIERFRREARAAGSLDHPAIVGVSAIGCQNGIHYYVMQKVDGASLDRRIAAARREPGIAKEDYSCGTPLLGPDRYKRIALMMAQAADAVHAAHTAGIIHRDIKPSNLLLGNDGQLRITDFGLARIQHGGGLTRTGDLVGTFRYMSPEQARGRSDLIDARTDVYGLGVTLYELATLKQAFRGDDGPALLRKIDQTVPKPPRAISPSIPVALETIIRRAMRPEPAERYASAAEMGADLRRFSRGDKIDANRITIVEQVTAWTRNHATTMSAAFAAMVAALIVSLVCLGLLLDQQSKTRWALELAEKNYDDARRAVDTLGLETADRLLPIPGTGEIRQELLAQTLAYYEDFIAGANSDPALARDVAMTRLKIGQLVSQLDSPVAAIESYQIALDQLRKSSQDIAVDKDLCRALNEAALLYSDSGKHDQAISLLDEAIAIAENLATAKQSLLSLPLTHNNLGVVLLRTAQHSPDSNELQQKAAYHIQLAVKELRSFDPKSLTELDDRSLARDLADALSNLSVVLDRNGNNEESILLARQSIDLQRAATSNRQIDLQGPRRLAVSLNNLAVLEWRAGEVDRSINTYKQSVTLLENALKENPYQSANRRLLAVTLNNLGMAQASAKRFVEAVATYRRAIAVVEPTIQGDPQNADAADQAGGIYNNLGVLLKEQGNRSDALEMFEKARLYQAKVVQLVPDAVKSKQALEQIESNLRDLN